MEFIDGHAVVETRVRFRLRGVVEEREAARVRDGDIILWLVRARCLPPQYFPVAKDNEERYKLSIQDVEQVAPLDGALRESAIVYLDHGQDQGYISLEAPALPLDLAFGAPRHTPIGVIDPVEVAEVGAVREYLSDLGELREGETLVNAVRRLVEQRTPTGAERFLEQQLEDPDYAAAYERATAALRDDPPAPSPTPDRRPQVPLLNEGDVEVVGRLRRGRRDLDDLLTNAFGDQ